jgi:hemerythrin-like domain-containing protein
MSGICQYLIADHARLHELLTRARSGSQLDHAAFAAFRAGLLRHIGIEEKILFPAVREALGGVSLQSALELRVEHGAIASLLVPTPDLELARELAALLAAHDATEDEPEGVYEQCETILGETRSRALTERARNAPEVPVAAHYDGPTVHRTAASALNAARRATTPRFVPIRPTPR